MNEIEKLYKNVGIKLRCSLWHRVLEVPTTSICEGICDNNELCLRCLYGPYKNTYYPPFTAEKQIELIKWLLYHELIDYLKMSYTSEEGGILDISIKCMSGYSYSNDDDDDFDIALASLINGLWEDLTEEERQQIKEILNV